MPTAAKLLSYEEWLELPENDDTREECVNGVVEKMPPPKFEHAWIVKRLSRQLENQVDERKVFVADTSFGLIIRQNPVTQRTPDIAVFVLADMVRRDGYVHSAPELAIEVLSPSNPARRVRDLLSDYASIGVPEVWTVNPNERTITIYLLENGAYRSTERPHDGVTNLLRFPSVTIDFSAIWP